MNWIDIDKFKFTDILYQQGKKDCEGIAKIIINRLKIIYIH